MGKNFQADARACFLEMRPVCEDDCAQLCTLHESERTDFFFLVSWKLRIFLNIHWSSALHGSFKKYWELISKYLSANVVLPCTYPLWLISIYERRSWHYALTMCLWFWCGHLAFGTCDPGGPAWYKFQEITEGAYRSNGKDWEGF